jgi:hypothetical protein
MEWSSTLLTAASSIPIILEANFMWFDFESKVNRKHLQEKVVGSNRGMKVVEFSSHFLCRFGDLLLWREFCWKGKVFEMEDDFFLCAKAERYIELRSTLRL